MMRFLFFTLLFFSGTLSAQSELKRLDPHGSVDFSLKSPIDLKEHRECSVCHESSPSSTRILTKPKANETCTDCHTKKPHSGAMEHLGKAFNGQTIQCSTCHSPHRADGKAWESPTSAFQQKPEIASHLPYVVKNSATGMIRKTCSECHKW